MVLVVIGSLLWFGGDWAYSEKQVSDWQSLVFSSSKSMRQSQADCKKNRDSTSCEFTGIWKESFDRAVGGRDKEREKADLFALLVYLVPAIALILFYSLCWVLTGRLKPLIVRDNTKSMLNKGQE